MKLIFEKLIFWYYNFILHQPMAQGKNIKTAPRARLAHKLAKYVRANPIHIQSRLSTQNPSTTHLSNSLTNHSLRRSRKEKIEKQRQHLVPSWWWDQAPSKKKYPTQTIHRKKISPTRQHRHSSRRKTQRKKSRRPQNPFFRKPFGQWSICRQWSPTQKSQSSLRHCHFN